MSAFSSQHFPFLLSTCHTFALFFPFHLSPPSQAFLRASKDGAEPYATRSRSRAKKRKCPRPKCQHGHSQTKQEPQEETWGLWTTWRMRKHAAAEETASQARQQGRDQEEAHRRAGKANQLFQSLSADCGVRSFITFLTWVQNLCPFLPLVKLPLASRCGNNATYGTGHPFCRFLRITPCMDDYSLFFSARLMWRLFSWMWNRNQCLTYIRSCTAWCI